MIPGLTTTAEEETVIGTAFSSWADHFRVAFRQGGIDYLIHKYEKLVTELELLTDDPGAENEPLVADWDEFLNDLSVRKALQIVLDAINVVERERLQARVDPIDERFRRRQVGTEFILASSLKSKYPESKFWWYYGLPKGVHD